MSAITAKASRKMKKYAVLTREPRCFLGSFDFSWEQRKFSELVQIERGGSPRPIDDFITDAPNGLNWIKIGDAPTQGNYITKTAEKIRPEGLSKTREVHPGDLILSNSMSFGKPYIMGIDGCIHDGWLLIRNTYGVFDLTFLCHLLGTPQMLSQYRSLAAGSTVNNLNKELVGNTVVTIPSITEQRVLGDYLEQLDNLITLHQRKFEKLTNVKKSMLEKMFPQNGSSYPEIRFKGFTDPWEQRKVSDLAEKTYGGGTPTTSNEAYWNGDIPWIQSSDVVDGKLLGVEPRKWITQDGLNNSAAQLIPENSIAIITRVGVGKLAFMPYSYATSQDFLSLSKLNVEPFFAVYACHKKLQSELNAVQGTSIKGITKDELLAKSIMVPRYAEQQQIGAFFKQLDNLITLHQRECISFTGRADRLILTANKKRTTSSWEQRKLSELTSMHARIGWQNLRTSEFLDSGNYMLITGTDFNDGAINFSTCHYVERERYEQDRNIQIHNGSILITKDGTLGKVAYVQGLSMPATLNAGVFNVQIKDANNVDEKYLFQYLKAPFLMDYVDKKATGGTIKHLNQSILVDFPVILPQRSEQTLIGAFFLQLDNLITLHQRELEKLQNIKKSMLEKMFV